MKYQPKIDYRRKRGLIEEINRSILSVEQDLEIMRGMGAQRGVKEGGIDYDPPPAEDPAGGGK
jgi:hypothetical protein